MIYFNLPGLYENFHINKFFLSEMYKNPQFFNDNVKIASVFGNFPFCIWDGGRNFAHYEQVSSETIKEVCSFYRNYGIYPRLVFTNPRIQKEDLYDRFGNLTLKIVNDYQGEVVVNSDLMENYIRENYPNYKIISSTTKRLSDPKKALNEICDKNYYQVCLDYDLNKNIEFLNSIPKEKRKNVEFLSNAICPSHCAFRQQHYNETGLVHLSYVKHKYTVTPYCGIGGSLNTPAKLGQGNNLSFEDIVKYNKMGFQYFKLEGRTLASGTVFANYLYYLVKPKCQYNLIEVAINSGVLLNGYNDLSQWQFLGDREITIVNY